MVERMTGNADQCWAFGWVRNVSKLWLTVMVSYTDVSKLLGGGGGVYINCTVGFTFEIHLKVKNKV